MTGSSEFLFLPPADIGKFNVEATEALELRFSESVVQIFIKYSNTHNYNLLLNYVGCIPLSRVIRALVKRKRQG